ncbi:MAG: hypothetical protein AAGA74_16215 [Pseudomonadota bacterium]
MTDQIEAAQAELSEMMNSAARLPDGTHVFRDANGVVRREDGTAVENHLAGTIIWTGHEPSFEDVQAAKDRIDGLQGQLDAANGYQNDVLGPARDRITDPENPPSLGELDDIQDSIQGSIPDAVKAHLPETVSTAAPDLNPLAVSLPDLGTKP